MKTMEDLKKFLVEIFLGIFILTSINPNFAVAWNSWDIIYPLKEISKLECRFTKFWELSSSCKQKLPVLRTKDYKKYATKDWWYNNYTRLYTVLWWASYKYWWDVWNWWHMWVDIATAEWTPIYSIAEWTVIVAKKDWSFWNVVSIKHKINWKTIVSNYAHMSKIIASVWQKVNAWTKIWLVWTTWNSTWNHLHFQIDLQRRSYPGYYNYKTCPYSYYEISEKWVCFDELEKITLDPLLFLETKWKILDNVKTTTVSRENFETNKNKWEKDLDIFYRTVYIWYSTYDIKRVQDIFTTLWYYKWKITWNYKDVENSIIKYQLDKKVISNKNEEWAWRFWPKTRKQAKKDYLIALKSDNNNSSSNNSSNNDTQKEEIIENINNNKTEKISRKNLLTREEIEAREVRDFLKNYKLELKLINIWWNIQVWKTEILKLTIQNKKWKPFKWNMPSWMTFIVDQSKVSVFPQKLYYFTDWKRDIKLTWLKSWNTNLYIKVWNQTIETIPLKVYSNGTSIKARDWAILWVKNIVLWEEKTWMIVFKDDNWKKLVNVRYDSNYKLKTSKDVKICLKSWNINNLKNIYKKKCRDSDYKDFENIVYDKTVWWIVVFDYKVSWRDAKIELINWKEIKTNKILVQNPKWLKTNYEYKNEVVEMLEEWLVDWINKWYFLEKRELTKYDWLSWIRNTLIHMNENPQYFTKKKEIEKNLREVYNLRQKASKFTSINRKELLDLTYKYLVFDKNNNWFTREYLDLKNNENIAANKIFYKNNTWKDKFWEKYFRPNIKVTRWEWAYLLANIMKNNKQVFLTLK